MQSTLSGRKLPPRFIFHQDTGLHQQGMDTAGQHAVNRHHCQWEDSALDVV